MPFSTALGCFRFCEFLEDILHSPASDTNIESLARRWGWPRSTISGHLNKRTSPAFDRVCDSFYRMSLVEQDSLLGGITHACPEILFSREPAVRTPRRELLSIAAEVTQVDQQILLAACDGRTSAREKLSLISQHNQLRRRLGEEMIASLQMQLARAAI